MSLSTDFIISNGILEKYNGTSSEVTVPEGVREIGLGAFRHCRSLKSIVLPNDISGIDSNAFEFCTELTGTLPFQIPLSILGITLLVPAIV